MNLFEALYLAGLVVLFVGVFAWAAGMLGWGIGLFAAVAAVGVVIGLTVLIARAR